MTQTKEDKIVEAVCSSIKAFDDKILENMLKTIVAEKVREAIRLTASEIKKEIDTKISWYDSYNHDGETDKEILQQANAIVRVLKELNKWLSEGEEK